jgi:hypothetical protein
MSSLTLAAGESNLNQDFGFNGDAAVGDTVWIDTNGNGILDGLEPTIPGVPITVTSAGVDGVLGTDDDIVVMTVTDVDGMYFVDGLPPGPTQVSYLPSDLPNGLAPTSDLDGGTGDQAATATVDLVNGEPNRDVDFAVGGTGTLDGVVFEDPNGNGMQDPGEPGIPGVTVIVTLAGPDGPIVIPVVTGPDGSWSLDNLPPGDYTVAIDPTTVPPGIVSSNPPTTVTLPDGGSVTVDIPAVPTGTVVGRVWIDNDRDGVQDPSEPGIAGVLVKLIDKDGNVIDSVITATGGGYTFANVVPGDYNVVIDVSTVPKGLDQTFENDGSRDLTVSVTAVAGESVNGGVYGFGPARPRPLPRTGLDMFGFLLAALTMVVSGGFLVLSDKRKRPTAR